MHRLAAVLWLALPGAASAAAPPVPSDLSSLLVTDTIHGRVTPAFATAVVCAFVEDTSAVCWQYSPVTRAFVKVGGWTT